jgi:hypothetical protein
MCWACPTGYRDGQKNPVAFLFAPASAAAEGASFRAEGGGGGAGWVGAALAAGVAAAAAEAGPPDASCSRGFLAGALCNTGGQSVKLSH